MENSANNEILVTISCITYNHEPYIRKALDGFVNQKTNFKYEIIVHDDASTDGTADVVREYAEKYPDLFVPILQKENMHSKGVKISSTFIYPIARGKYIALCEGDDFWTDEEKLQKQIDFLEKHSEYTACTHAHTVFDMRYNTEKEVHPFEYTGTVTTNDVIEGDGALFATASIVAKTEFVRNRKPFQDTASVGDYPLIISLALDGKIYYLNEVMSCYRFMSPGSWNVRNWVDTEKRKAHLVRLQATLEEIDRYSGLKYHDSFMYVIDRMWFIFYFKKYSVRKLKKLYKSYYNRLTGAKKVALYFSKYMPSVYNKLMTYLRQKNVHLKAEK